MNIVITLIILAWIWIGYEIYTAPMMDENGKILKEGKNLSDLFKKK